MKLRHLIILASLLLIICNADSQMSSEFWITVQSDSPPPNFEKLLFGNHVNATYGLDSLNPTLIEKCYMPGPPWFEASWMDLSGRPRKYAPLLLIDIRGIPTDPTQADTFIVGFYDNNTDADFTFHWPESSYLAKRCDSMFLFSRFFPKINMFDVDSLVIQDAQDSNINRISIYKYGCKIIDVVNEEKGIISTTFILNQNYPNPFNPSTQITYSVPKATIVTLKVYDVLGREIAGLVNERKLAGEYNITWNAEGVPSGVYFYRIVAGDYIETMKMVVVK